MEGGLIKVPPQNTSLTCPDSSCQHIDKANRPKGGEAFRCIECGYQAHEGYVGALNILGRGHRVLACGVDSLESSEKQELVGSSDTRLLSSCC